MPASLDQQLEFAALERLRQRDNPFASNVATLEEQRYDVPELLEEQRRDIKAIIEQFRTGNRSSQVIPIIGDPGTGKTHLLGSLKRELDNPQQLLVISEGFPKERDPADFFLWQIVSLLLVHRRTSIQILTDLSNRVTARLLSETIRRLPDAGRLQLTRSSGFFSRVGRKLGLSAAVDEPLTRVSELLAVCDSPSFPEALSSFWDVGVDRQQVFQAVYRHLVNTESSDADGYVRRNVYGGMAMSIILGNRDGLVEFLTGGFTESPKYVEGAGDLTKRLLRVLLEIFATFQIPVVIAFDQLEDFIRSGSPADENERRQNFCRGLLSLTNAVPNLCVLLFAERGLWNEILTSLDRFSTDRLHKDIGLPGKPDKRDISLPDRFTADTLTTIIRSRIRPTLGEFDRLEQLPATFPFALEDLKELLQQTTMRGCLQQLGKRYASIVYSDGTSVPSPSEIHKYLTGCWDHHRIRAEAKIEDQSAADIPTLADNLKGWFDYCAEQPLSETIPWVKNQVVQHGHELFGHLNVIRTRPRSAGLGVGFWLAELKHRPTDLAAKLAFFTARPSPIRRLVVLRRDGTDALKGVSGDHFNKARNKGLDVRVEELTNDDLSVIWCFPQWLKAANAFILSLPNGQQEVGREALNDIARERTKSLFDKIGKWLADAAEEEAPA